MRNLKALLTIASLLIITSACKEDGTTPEIAIPGIIIEVSGLTVTDNVVNVSVSKDSTIILDYTVTASGVIQQLAMTVDGVEETVSEANGKEEYSSRVIIDTPYED